MTTQTGDVSLSTLRSSLSLSGNFRLTQRESRNRAQKNSGQIKLSDHRNVCIGQQLQMGGWNSSPVGYQASQHKYLDPVGTSNSYIEGEWYRISHKRASQDGGSETRLYGTGPTTGSYRLTGTVQWDPSGPARSDYELHVQLISNANGWLSGNQQVALNNIYKYLDRPSAVNNTVSFTYPYVTLIFRTINKNGFPTSTTVTHGWHGFKLVKI